MVYNLRMDPTENIAFSSSAESLLGCPGSMITEPLPSSGCLFWFCYLGHVAGCNLSRICSSVQDLLGFIHARIIYEGVIWNKGIILAVMRPVFVNAWMS
jgi:hypothetical protein